jgi:hypothetical protein
MRRPVGGALIVLLTLISSFSAYKISYSIGERYFFDKLFYKKSIKHGYWNGRSLELFGKRAADINNFYIGSLSANETSKILGFNKDSSFNIAIIGDSFVWGQGVKQNDRFPVLLEKKLNRIQNSKVYSLALPGDNILEHLVKYRLVQETLPIDLYIIVLSQSDPLIHKRNPNELNPDQKSELINQCLQKGQAITYDYEIENDWNQYQKTILESWSNPVNTCIIDKVISEFPTNSIFLIPDYLDDASSYSGFINLLNEKGLFTIFSSRAKDFDNYKNYWKDPYRYFTVSINDPHPGTVAHRMISDVLLEEIISNPNWKFMK